MTLQVVGTGLGRTGTKSLQTALAILGFGPCHHMVEIFAHPEQLALWIDAAHGRADWDAVFAGYAATVDYPGAHYWRAICAHFPAAKIIHTVRDPDAWFDSTQATIFAPGGAAMSAGPMAEFFDSFVGPLRAHLHDRAAMTAHFRRHTDEVLRTIAPGRLLVYQAGEGWEPLCRFLGVPIPETPYPSENSRSEFIARLGRRAAGPA
jgi:hypothetical protein